MTEPIERIEENLAYENRFVRIYDDDVRFADGSSGRYLRIANRPEGSEGVVVIARHQDRFALVRTYRYAIGQYQWAFPRGFAHGPDVTTTTTAELREEVGAEPQALKVLGHVTPDSGLLSTRVAVVLADVVSRTTAPEDTGEVDEVIWVTSSELRMRLANNTIDDAFTLSAWALMILQEKAAHPSHS